MTPEEISVNENFWYPLYLLIIGGGLSVGLIKLFNFLHEIKLTKIEAQRVESQKEIDRKREDHHKSLEIKTNLVKTISEIYAISINTLYSISADIYANKKTKQSILTPELRNKLFIDRTVAQSLVTAYFHQKKINDDYSLFDRSISSLVIVFNAINTRIPLPQKELQELEDYFKDKIDVNWDELNQGNNVISSWNKIASVIGIIKDDIILQIFNEEITVFDKK